MPQRPRRNDRRLQSPPKRSPPLDLWSRGGFSLFSGGFGVASLFFAFSHFLY